MLIILTYLANFGSIAIGSFSGCLFSSVTSSVGLFFSAFGMTTSSLALSVSVFCACSSALFITVVILFGFCDVKSGIDDSWKNWFKETNCYNMLSAWNLHFKQNQRRLQFFQLPVQNNKNRLVFSGTSFHKRGHFHQPKIDKGQKPFLVQRFYLISR